MSYRPARLHRLTESIPGLLKSLKVQAHLNKKPKPVFLPGTVVTVGVVRLLLAVSVRDSEVIDRDVISVLHARSHAVVVQVAEELHA